ncbi:MAG: hypothetical protein HQK81_13465 [Desulfovibrionaceae bacterium]|nr:hypothetical protein [Desulfovibrionaceae bacterium]MBF0515051.1 hypothetical protein [Desulfovibrionaceae bacterium]
MKLVIDVAVGCVCHFEQDFIEGRQEWKEATQEEKYHIIGKFGSVYKWSEYLTRETDKEMCNEFHGYNIISNTKKDIVLHDTSETPLYLCYFSTYGGKTYT